MDKYVTAKSTASCSITGESTFNTKYRWLDEKDLRTDYKDKPDVIESTLKNAKTFVCDVTKRKLYGMPIYESNDSQKSASKVSRAVEALSEAKQPPAKKPRIVVIFLCLFLVWFEQS